MAGRRGNGEGTVYQLPDGRWRGQATIAGKRAGVYGATRKEAQTKLRQLIGDADRGLLPPTERLTLAQHIERWLEDVVKRTRRPRTLENYRDMARLHILPRLGTMKLTQLQPAHLQQLYGAISDGGLSPKSVRIVHGVLHCALKQAVDWNLVPRNVASLANPPRVIRKEIQVFDPTQARHLLTTATDGRWLALMTMALATGMRQGELLGLTWGDVDLDAGLVRVRRRLGRDGELAETKTGGGRRVIDIPASTVKTLREHKRRQNEERLMLGGEWHDQGLLFCTHQGKPLNYRNMTREYKALLKKADLLALPFHALRHTAATLLLLQGVHPKVVQERLGHANISMTLDTYSHLIPSMGRDAADKLDALLA